MGFLAPAAPFIPMLVGAGAGALIDKDNPLRGAMLGAVGGSALGPAVAGMTGAGSAAGAEALAAGATPAAASSYGSALAGLAGPEQAAMLAAQTGEFGPAGLGTTINAFTPGPTSIIDKMAGNITGLANMGPQSALSAMSKPDIMKMGGRMILSNMQQPTAQQAPPPAVAGSAPARQAPPFQPVGRFVTGMPSMNRRKDPREEMWGYS